MSATCKQVEYIEKLEETLKYLNITQKELSEETEIPLWRIKYILKTSYSPREDEQEKIDEFILKRTFFHNYKCMSPEDFKNLLNELMKKFDGVITQQQIADEMGFCSQAEVSKLTSGDKKLNVEQQYKILKFFYTRCFDPFGRLIEEFKSVCEDLENKICVKINMLCHHSKEICTSYLTLCEYDIDFDEEITLLSKMSGIDKKDIIAILTSPNHTCEPKKKNVRATAIDAYSEHIRNCRIKEKLFKEIFKRVDAFWEKKDDIIYRCEYIYDLPSTEIHKAFDKFHLLNEFYGISLQENKIKKRYNEELIDWYKLLPDPLKHVVYEFSARHSRVMYCDPNTLFDILNYLNIDYSFCVNHVEFITALILRFRILSAEEKKNILIDLHENIKLDLPNPTEKNNVLHGERKNSYFKCAIHSFYLATLTEKKTLFELYESYPECELTLKKNKCIDRYSVGADYLSDVGISYLKEMLNYTSEEWQLAGYIECMIANCEKSSLHNLIYKIGL